MPDSFLLSPETSEDVFQSYSLIHFYVQNDRIAMSKSSLKTRKMLIKLIRTHQNYEGKSSEGLLFISECSGGLTERSSACLALNAIPRSELGSHSSHMKSEKHKMHFTHLIHDLQRARDAMLMSFSILPEDLTLRATTRNAKRDN